MAGGPEAKSSEAGDQDTVSQHAALARRGTLGARALTRCGMRRQNPSVHRRDALGRDIPVQVGRYVVVEQGSCRGRPFEFVERVDGERGLAAEESRVVEEGWVHQRGHLSDFLVYEVLVSWI